MNDPPAAQDDATITLEEMAINIPILGNDQVVDGDSLTLTQFTKPNNGLNDLEID